MYGKFHFKYHQSLKPQHNFPKHFRHRKHDCTILNFLLKGSFNMLFTFIFRRNNEALFLLFQMLAKLL